MAHEARQALEDTGVEVWPAFDGMQLLPGMASVVKSPGVPSQAPVVAAAR